MFLGFLPGQDKSFQMPTTVSLVTVRGIEPRASRL